MSETEQEKPPTGFPEPPGKDPGDRSNDPTPHHGLNEPADVEDPDERRDERDPHPDQDIEAPDANPPERDKLDE
jgi:hypothetical protein